MIPVILPITGKRKLSHEFLIMPSLKAMLIGIDLWAKIGIILRLNTKSSISQYIYD